MRKLAKIVNFLEIIIIQNYSILFHCVHRHVFEWVRPGAPNHVVKEFLVMEKNTQSTFTRQDAAKNPTPPAGAPEPREFLEDRPIAVEFINDASEAMEVYWRQGNLGSQTRNLIVKIEPGGRSNVNAQAQR